MLGRSTVESMAVEVAIAVRNWRIVCLIAVHLYRLGESARR